MGDHFWAGFVLVEYMLTATATFGLGEHYAIDLPK